MNAVQAIVCPTYVGMNRKLSGKRDFRLGMPHVCGDEPRTYNKRARGNLYAPRMWG